MNKVYFFILCTLALSYQLEFLQRDDTGNRAQLDSFEFDDSDGPSKSIVLIPQDHEPSSPDNDPLLVYMIARSNQIFYDDVIEEIQTQNSSR